MLLYKGRKASLRLCSLQNQVLLCLRETERKHDPKAIRSKYHALIINLWFCLQNNELHFALFAESYKSISIRPLEFSSLNHVLGGSVYQRITWKDFWSSNSSPYNSRNRLKRSLLSCKEDQRASSLRDGCRRYPYCQARAIHSATIKLGHIKNCNTILT
jgi:hypothetical protein